jgi:hypothetical protein
MQKPGYLNRYSYGLDERGIGDRFSAGTRDFPLLHSDQAGPGAHPASYTMGTESSFPGVKRLGREADHSPPSSAEVKNDGAILPLP